MVSREQIYSMAIYLIDHYGANARSVAQYKAAQQVANENTAGVCVWARIRRVLDELAPEPPPTIH